MEPADKLEWEAPAAIALTETESRADAADIWIQNQATAPSLPN